MHDTCLPSRGFVAVPRNRGQVNDLYPVPKPGYSVKLITCSTFPDGCHKSVGHWLMFILSLAVILLFTILLQFFLGVHVAQEKPRPISPDDGKNPVRNKPVRPGAGSNEAIIARYNLDMELYHKLHGKNVIFNDEGDLIEWTDSVYHKEVENRKSNPFTSLYAGFEFEWADYKKRVMMLKFQQIFLLALPTCNILARHAFSPTASSVLAALFALFCSGRFLYLTLKSTPYVDPVNDRMEIISKACLIITPTVVLILAIAPSVGANNAFGVILNIVAVVGNIGMVIALLYPLPAVQSFFKKLSGRLDFTSTDGITDHQDEKALPDWDLDVERMRRIWKPFWDKILFDARDEW